MSCAVGLTRDSSDRAYSRVRIGSSKGVAVRWTLTSNHRRPPSTSPLSLPPPHPPTILSTMVKAIESFEEFKTLVRPGSLAALGSG